ncbi:hypothetical protein N7530_006307 [Penicillium desertorum]|uniref:Uncharacterized protein n=1 Tax=Penicillium desertorum TaxID=1303715 RepID=A0A9W9WRE4_9EURO|nr:hypothetical protein N7530_006307 [Penicillium desertorum]
MPKYAAEFPASAPSRAWNRTGNALENQSDIIGNRFVIILASCIIARVEELLIVAEYFWLGQCLKIVDCVGAWWLEVGIQAILIHINGYITSWYVFSPWYVIDIAAE